MNEITLDRQPLDYTYARERRHDLRQLEPGRIEERAKFHLLALPPAGGDQHVDVIRRRAAAQVRLIDPRRVYSLRD